MPTNTPPPRPTYTTGYLSPSAPRLRDACGRFVSASDATHTTPTSGLLSWSVLMDEAVAEATPVRPFIRGDIVSVSDTPSSDAARGGYVSSAFNGARCTVVSDETEHGGVDVSLASGHVNTIHRNWLMLEVSGPETDGPRTLLDGDTVTIHSPAYYRTGDRGTVPSEFFGLDAVVDEPYGMDAYTVETSRGEVVVHRDYLTFVERPEPLAPLLVGQNVRIMEGARRRLSLSSRTPARFYNRLGTIHTRDGSTYYVNSDIGSGTWVHRNYLTVVTDEEWAAIPRCQNVNCNRALDNDAVLVDTDSGDGCSRCARTCVSCEETDLTSYRSFYNVRGTDGNVCEECAIYCNSCGNYYVDEGEGCPYVSDHPFDRGVRGYGHTTPSMWIGGPLPKVDGKIDTSAPGAYYIGFELEISADDDESAMPIYEWAEQHLGSRDAIQCKEDSSLNDGGFEIVTMPMTPAFFESVDWESFMDLINENHPITRRDGLEPTAHGLHVHIGRIAFGKDDVATAAYTYLLSQSNHLDRIARREPYHYCAKVRHPVSVAIQSGLNHGSGRHTKQTAKIAGRGIYPGRDAINLQNPNTIEIRAFRSTRSADELRDAVRATYVAAEYVRSLRMGRRAVSPKALHWAQFAAWVGTNHPEAFPSIAGIEKKGGNRRELAGAAGTFGTPSYDM